MAEREATRLETQTPEPSGSFQSPFSVFECQERLLEAIEGASGVDIYGDVTTERFELHRGTRVRAGAHPVLTGRFSQVAGGTQVNYRLGRSKANQPYMRIAASIWAIMALSWVVFFVYWIVDPEGIDIGLSRLLLLLGIVLLMGATIAAGRRTEAQGGAELLEVLREALELVEGVEIAGGMSSNGLEER